MNILIYINIKISIIGTGNVAQALIKGLISKNITG
ncbi:NAD(P)-binding domain-containing protein [Apibacter mensalis]